MPREHSSVDSEVYRDLAAVAFRISEVFDGPTPVSDEEVKSTFDFFPEVCFNEAILDRWPEAFNTISARLVDQKENFIPDSIALQLALYVTLHLHFEKSAEELAVTHKELVQRHIDVHLISRLYEIPGDVIEKWSNGTVAIANGCEFAMLCNWFEPIDMNCEARRERYFVLKGLEATTIFEGKPKVREWDRWGIPPSLN